MVPKWPTDMPGKFMLVVDKILSFVPYESPQCYLNVLTIGWWAHRLCIQE